VTGYKMIKFCRLCKKKFFAFKGEYKKNYCDECQAKFDQENEENKLQEEKKCKEQ